MEDKILLFFEGCGSISPVNTHSSPSDLGGNVANPVGAISDVLGGSHGAGSQSTRPKAKVDLEGASVLIGDIAGLVVAPTILQQTPNTKKVPYETTSTRQHQRQRKTCNGTKFESALRSLSFKLPRHIEGFQACLRVMNCVLGGMRPALEV